jgi:hypothetical protein
MFRPRLSTVLLFNAGVALSVAACGGGTADNKGTGGGSSVGAGATGGTTGGSAGKVGTGGTTGGTGGTTGGSAGKVGTGGTAGGTGGTTGGSAGMASGSGGMGVGGTFGMAGSSAVGGSGGMPAGGAGSGAGGSSSGGCTITSMATQSDTISTVFNVTFTSTLATVDSAQIDFGLDTTYGYTAPVDPKAPSTMLLGMKPSKTYHYRVSVTSGGMTCMGTDQTVMTGPIANGLPKGTITTNDATKLAGGFMLSEWYAGKQDVFIMDKDLDIVWWFDPKSVVSAFSDLTRARMSTDGKTMWIAHGNVPQATAHMMKVSMDGSNPQDLSSTFTDLNHDFTIVNDAMGDWIYFVAYGANKAPCDDIKEYNPTNGMVRTVMNIGKAFSSGSCHANAVEYSKDDDTLVVSELDHSAYVKIKRTTGDIVWVLGGGTNNQFTGDAATWTNEHNLQVISATDILMFNNGAANAGSNAIEMQLDTNAKTATKLWEYTASPLISNVVMGDVQRLPNGNTLVSYSTQGVIHEVDANKNLLQSISWGTGGAIGYVIKRPTLYGPSPK